MIMFERDLKKPFEKKREWTKNDLMLLKKYDGQNERSERTFLVDHLRALMVIYIICYFDSDTYD